MGCDCADPLVSNSCVTVLLLHPERAEFAGTGVAVGPHAETLQCLPTARAGCFLFALNTR